MNCTYQVLDGVVVKKYENGDSENLCLLKDIDVVIDRTRETLDRMSDKLAEIMKEDKDSVVSIMFHSYIEELNELKKLKVLNK